MENMDIELGCTGSKHTCQFVALITQQGVFPLTDGLDLWCYGMFVVLRYELFSNWVYAKFTNQIAGIPSSGLEKKQSIDS